MEYDAKYHKGNNFTFFSFFQILLIFVIHRLKKFFLFHADVDFNSERLLATQAAREKMQKKFLEDRRIALLKEEEVW